MLDMVICGEAHSVGEVSVGESQPTNPPKSYNFKSERHVDQPTLQEKKRIFFRKILPLKTTT